MKQRHERSLRNSYESTDADEFIHSSDDGQLLPAFLLGSPAKSAAPFEVRQYVVDVLQRRGIAPNHAESVAAKWTIGTGVELRTYPVAMFQKIFGPDEEDVWMVYSAVKAQLYREQAAAETSTMTRFMLFVVSFAVTCTCVVVAINAINTDNDVWTGIAIGLGMISAPVDMGLLAWTFSQSDPDERAARELQEHLYKKIDKGQSDKSTGKAT